MTTKAGLRKELEKLRRDIESMRGIGSADAPADGAEDAGGIVSHIKELQQMVQETLDDADETVAEHPRAAIAGALALGIVIGRLTLR